MKHCLFLCACTLVLSSCQLFSGDEEDKNAATVPDKKDTKKVFYIGTVYKIYPDAKFALVRVIQAKPNAGTTLISRPPDGSNARVGNLVVSPQTVSNNITPLIAADIRAGQLQVGDPVYIYQAIGEKSPDIAKQDAAEDTNVSETLGTELPPLLEGSGMTEIADQIPAGPTSDQRGHTVAPTVPAVKPPSQQKIPDSIKNIPDTYEGWENM